MAKSVIKVENVSKVYRLGEIGTGSMGSDINRWWVTKVLGGEDPYLRIGQANDRATKGDSDVVYSLCDVSFEVQQGEVLGIIGKNGAGKSTLLKILSRITAPTTGRVKMKGRVASLLEVGTGFHPELTGRENIFLNGSILGMRKHEIARKLDEIIDFSGVERYIDTPVKRYSSGMYVRLAFAVAAHLQSEILIVDEVLAVGDAEFQKKCLGRMKDVSTNEGRTVLFVSHQMDAIVRLCANAIVLENGKILFDGDTKNGIEIYSKETIEIKTFKQWINGEDKMPGNEFVRLLSVRVLSSNNNSGDAVIYINNEISINMEYDVLVDDFEFVHGLNIYNSNGLHVFSSHDVERGKQKIKASVGRYMATVRIPGNFLSNGFHSVSVAIMSYDPYIVHFHQFDSVAFEVVEVFDLNSSRGRYGGAFPGVVRPKLNWSFNKIDL